MTGEKGSENIFATDTVRRTFDPVLLNFLGEKAGIPLIIITPEEVRLGSFIIDLRMNTPIGTPEKRAGSIFNDVEERIRNHIQKNFPDFPTNISKEAINNAAQIVLINPAGASAHGIEIHGDNINDSALMTTPFMDMTKVRMASAISNIPESELKHLPGTDAEWRTIILFHEVGHTSQTPYDLNRDKLMSEAGADQTMLTLEKEALERGIIKTPGIGEAFMAMRALGSISVLKFHGDHSTGPAVQTPGEDAPYNGSGETALSGLKAAIEKIYSKVGFDVSGPSDAVDVMNGIINKVGDIPENERTLIKETIKTIQSKKYTLDDVNNMVSQMQKNLSKDTKAIFESALQNAIFSNGAEILDNDPHLKYETVRHMYEAGDFDDNLIGKQYAKEFLDAAVKYAPGYFGIQNSPEPKPDPFKRLGADATPTPPDAPALTPKV
ncbi:MAG TPA: hypothetical protein DEA55_01180 [Rhodospirillaceae bacterium]|nr:hypothetical protein [Rhodospirillaceae bacterium]